MKLITMTDFVLSQTTPDYLEFCEFEENSYKIHNYAKFLKQPLELWMFVPCNEDGNVLEEKSLFNTTDEDYIFNSEYFDKYQRAKERCLFEGLDLGVANHHIRQERKVEYLANFGFLELTKTSIKQLGL